MNFESIDEALVQTPQGHFLRVIEVGLCPSSRRYIL